MGGGDLNMKKSWHPVLLVNQERVWKAEKAANEERKQLAQLRKEREEERQIAELKRMQEVATGKKAVERLDWMYASSGNEGGALGGARISETMMEDYLLGKRRVDEVLAQSDKNVGNTHKDFIAVQNANTARDTAAKIREDPLLAIKKQEEAQLRAMANRPDIRRQLKAMKTGREESKEERKARKRAEKEERRKERHERRERKRERDDSPRSDYSDDRDRRRSYGRDRDDYKRDDRRRYRSRSRSSSPYSRRRDDSPRRRDRDDRDDYRRRDDSPERVKLERDDARDNRRSKERDDDRVPPPRRYSNGHDNRGNGRNDYSNGHSNGHVNGSDGRPRPNAMDMSDRPTSRPPPPTSATNPNGKTLEEQRAARLAAMSQNAHSMQDQRNQSLAARAEQDRREAEKDAKMRQRLGTEAANAGFFNQQRELGLSEALSRRGGQGLQRDI